MRKLRFAKIGPDCVWHVVDKIRPAAIFRIAPKMAQIKPMPDLVSGRASEVKRGNRRPVRAKCFVINYYAVGRCGAARKLCVTKQTTAKIAHPLKIVHLKSFQYKCEKDIIKWCPFRVCSEWLGTELNRRHADFQSAALPTELPSLICFANLTAKQVL